MKKTPEQIEASKEMARLKARDRAVARSNHRLAVSRMRDDLRAVRKDHPDMRIIRHDDLTVAFEPVIAGQDPQKRGVWRFATALRSPSDPIDPIVGRWTAALRLAEGECILLRVQNANVIPSMMGYICGAGRD